MDMRDRILQLVRDYPGLHLRELARQADTSLHLVQHHLHRLEEGGFVEVAAHGGKSRVYPPDLREDDRVLLGALRDRRRLRIAMVLLDAGPLPHRAIAAAVKMGKSTLSFHLRNMVEGGVLEKQDGDYAVRDAQRVKVILDRYRPTPDAADRIADVWGKIYGRS